MTMETLSEEMAAQIVDLKDVSQTPTVHLGTVSAVGATQASLPHLRVSLLRTVGMAPLIPVNSVTMATIVLMMGAAPSVSTMVLDAPQTLNVLRAAVRMETVLPASPITNVPLVVVLVTPAKLLPSLQLPLSAAMVS